MILRPPRRVSDSDLERFGFVTWTDGSVVSYWWSPAEKRRRCQKCGTWTVGLHESGGPKCIDCMLHEVGLGPLPY